MCGILGVVSRSQFDEGRFAAAAALQTHRGPDSSGDWASRVGDWHVRFGHQRLAILDLSAKGAQPMVHPVTGSVLVYNGEIYNFVELCSDLSKEGIELEGHSDTEVLLHCLEHWGIEKTLQCLNGMWAFAWLDARNGCLHLSRDRCGEKPLYWSQTDDRLYFASELKTLLALLAARASLNLQAIGGYLVQGLLNTGPETFFKNIHQTRAGVVDRFALTAAELGRHEQRYWSCPTESESSWTEESFVECLRQRFLESVRMRLRSDVPVGILLSGGLDSSSIVGAAKAIGAQNLTLLSLVSDDSRFDESPFIDRVAAHVNWPVTKVRLPFQPAELFGHLERAVWHADVPLTDMSNVAHYLLLRAAKERGITVVLSGQGADELLCGYRKFLGFYLQELVRNGRYLCAARTLAGFVRNATIVNQFSWADAKRYLPKLSWPSHPDVFGPALQGFRPVAVGLDVGSNLSQRQCLDLLSFSVPKLNHTEDRMSMASSTEIRLPFLDHALIELLIPAPPTYKLHRGWTKFALRRAMQPFLPDPIVWRKDKQGFINPQADWLKHQLRAPILADYFQESSHIFRMGFYNRVNLLRVYDQYCEQSVVGGSIATREIITPIGMEIWLRMFIANFTAPQASG